MSYYLVQTVLIQDLSLHNAQDQIADLQRQLADAQQASRQAPTSFLGGLFGRSRPGRTGSGAVDSGAAGGGSTPVQPQPYGQPAQGGYSQPMAAPGGFVVAMGWRDGPRVPALGRRVTTAAGIAGGALLFQGIQSLFGHQASAGIRRPRP